MVTVEAFFGGYGNFGASSQAYFLGENSSGIFITQWGTGVGGPTLQPGTWHHVAATNVGNGLTLYLDGNIVGQTNVPISTPSGTQFYSGRIPGSFGDVRRLQGAVDEIKIFDRALSESEIIELASMPDVTLPEINSEITGTLANNGWHTGDVSISWFVTDPHSSVSSSNGCEDANVTNDTLGVTFTCSATSAGGTATQSVTIKRDTAAPLVSCESADGSWHADDVSIACNSVDATSGLSTVGDASFSLSTAVAAGSETANASTGTLGICDIAGNCGVAGPVSGIKIDKKAPVITVAALTGGSYLLNQAVTAGFTCVDGGSGVANCTGTTVNGGAIDTGSAGMKAFTVSSADNVGNAADPTTVSYTVVFGLEVLFNQTKAHKSGSTVPIKVRLIDANGVNVSSVSTLLHAINVVQISNQASTTLDDAGNSNPDFDFRYDVGSGGYIFNLKTTGYGTGSYLLNFVAGNSPSNYSVRFQVRQ